MDTKKLLQAIEAFGKILTVAEEELHLKSPKAVEISLRRRAIQGRRTSWIFLIIITLLVGTAGFVVWGLLGNINSVEKSLLDNYSNQLKVRLKEAEDTKKQLDETLSNQKNEVLEYLTGLGVQWEEVTPEPINSANSLEDFIFTPTGDVLALVNNNRNYFVWKSENGGNSWQAGEEIENLGPFARLIIKEDRLFVEGRFFDENNLFFSDNMGINWSKIVIPEPELDCGSRQIFQDISKDWYLFGLMCSDRSDSIDSKFLLISTEEKKTIELKLPEENITVKTIKILSDNNKLVIVGSNNEQKMMHWERDLVSPEGQWSESIELPKAEQYVPLENRILAINTQKGLREAEIFVWDITKANLTNRRIIFYSEADSSKWENFNRIVGDDQSSRNFFFSTFDVDIGNNNLILKLRDREREYIWPAFLIDLSNNNIDLIDPKTSIIDQNFLLAQTDSGQNIKQIDIQTQSEINKTNLPNFDFLSNKIIKVIKDNNNWLLVNNTSGAGEKSLAIWQRSKDIDSWYRRHPPEELNVGRIIGNWKITSPDENTLILAIEELGTGVKILRTIPYEPPPKFDDSSQLLDYLQKEAPRTVEHWESYDSFVINLGLLAQTEKRIIEIKDTMDQLGFNDNGKTQNSGNELGQTQGIWELLIASFVRLLILGLIFFVVQIFINLYRYFLRLAAY
ncbi:MAG: hypothetical protein QNJ55_19805 [Xenococcus sp. MO_188.B8]|nr:hypothetical protein [Xenococcus sp. MO_188.B8]